MTSPFRKLDSPELLAEIAEGATYVNGVRLVEENNADREAVASQPSGTRSHFVRFIITSLLRNKENMLSCRYAHWQRGKARAQCAIALGWLRDRSILRRRAASAGVGRRRAAGLRSRPRANPGGRKVHALAIAVQ